MAIQACIATEFTSSI